MTDEYADIRAALDAGPTRGPWFCHDTLGHAVAAIGKARIAADAQPAADPSADIRYIAACHPEAIRALLAERDALREALDELANGYAGTGWDIGLVQRIKKARAALAQEQEQS